MLYYMPLAFSRACILVLLVSTVNAKGNYHSFLTKRDDIPQATVNIPLTLTKERRYVVDVNMSSTSSDPQPFKFALVSNTGYSAVAGSACDNCGNSVSYNASASTTESSFPGSVNLTLGTGSLSGPFIKENCSLTIVNGSAWQYPNQTIINTNSSSSLFSDLTSGIFGMGTNANGASGDFLDTVYGGWLSRNPTQDNFSFGMDLLPPVLNSDSNTGSGGRLDWVSPNSDAYQANVAWNNIAPTSSQPLGGTTTSSSNTGFELPDADWVITMDGWSLNVNSATVTNATSSPAILEVLTPDILFPINQANLFYSSIPNSASRASSVSSIQEWTLPCDTELALSFVFSDQPFPLDHTQLIQTESDGTCVGAVKANLDSINDSFVLGSTFLSAFYIIFVVGRPGSKIPNTVGISQKLLTPTKSTSIGAIVGGTVGGVAFLTILLSGAIYWRRRRRSTQNTSRESTIRNVNPNEKRKEYESDSNHGSQYAYFQPSSLYSNIHQLPTPPVSGQSTHPLLSENRFPRSTASSAPHTPHTANSFNQTAVGSSTSLPSREQVAMHVTYNPNALEANNNTSRSAQVLRSDWFTDTPVSDRIEPFRPHQGSEYVPTYSENRRGLIGVSSRGSGQNEMREQGASSRGLQNSSTLRNIDPFAPTTTAGGTISPFVLSAAPRVAGPRSKPSELKLVNDDAQGRSVALNSPAPPYSLQAPGRGSSTLVNSLGI